MSADPAEIEIRRAPRIKAEDVFAAADALLVDGHRPTIDRVRMKLGRGSPNTINEHLDAWWSNLGARLRDLPGQVLPGLPEAVTNSLLHLWNLAVRESHTALLASLEARETALVTAASDLDQRARTFEAVRTTLEQAHAAAQTQLQEANQRARTLETTLQQRDSEAAEQRKALAKVEQTAALSHSALEEERRARSAERTRLDERYDVQQERWSQETDRLRHALKDEQKLAKDVGHRLDKALVERDEARRRLTHATADLQNAVSHQKQLEARLREAAAGGRPAKRRAVRKRKRAPKAPPGTAPK